MAVFTSQPQTGSVAIREFPGGVSVRNMVMSDSDFAGKLLVQSFEGKFEHAVGRRNLPNAVLAASEEHRVATERYHRIFIAEYEGRLAGLMELKFHGEKTSDVNDAYQRHLGCWPLCRLSCLGMMLDETVPRTKCYLDHIAVDEGFRGKGVGKVLLQVADEEALRNGCKYIYLWVADGNRAKNLYERHGYVDAEHKSGCCIKCLTGLRGFSRVEKILAI